MFGSKHSIAMRLGVIVACVLALIAGLYQQPIHAAAFGQQPPYIIPPPFFLNLDNVPGLPVGVVGCAYDASYSDVSLFSWSTSQHPYVSTQIDYTGGDYGMLRARASSIGPWEKYDIFRAGSESDPYYAIKSRESGEYVTTEVDYASSYNHAMLRARATTIGDWEKYYLCVDTLDYWVIISRANKLGVSMEFDYTGTDYGMLRARATSVGPWEEFGLMQN